MTTLTLPDRTLAYQQHNASPEKAGKPGLVFLGGYLSDMTGTKALFLDEQCRKEGLGFLRFDYRGHGASSGRFEDGCIGDWFDDALQIFEALTKGPQIVIGSSMGGWIGLLLARARPERLAGFIGIAAAPDFTEDLVWPFLSDEKKAELEKNGKIYETVSPPDHVEPLTKKLLDEGRDHLLLRAPLQIDAPIRLFQGMKDDQVPWKTALRIAERATSEDVRVTLIKDGDHRLSRPQDLAMIWREIAALVS